MTLESVRRAKYVLGPTQLHTLLRLPESVRVPYVYVTRDPERVHVVVEGDGVPPVPLYGSDMAEMAANGYGEMQVLPLMLPYVSAANTAEAEVAPLEVLGTLLDAARSAINYGIAPGSVWRVVEEALSFSGPAEPEALRAFLEQVLADEVQLAATPMAAEGPRTVVNACAVDEMVQSPEAAERERVEEKRLRNDAWHATFIAAKSGLVDPEYLHRTVTGAITEARLVREDDRRQQILKVVEPVIDQLAKLAARR